MNEGWMCPKCKAVMAPWASTCVNCSGKVSLPYPNTTTWTPNGIICPRCGIYYFGSHICSIGTAQ